MIILQKKKKSFHLVTFRDHLGDLEVGIEGELGNALEAFLEVRLNPGGVLRLGQDLQKFRVREEEEPGEALTLTLLLSMLLTFFS